MHSTGLHSNIMHLQWAIVLCIVVNLVLLRHVAVVKAAKDVFSWSIDCATEEEVGEKKLVAAVVQLVVSVRSHGSESFSCNFVKGVPGQSGEVLIEVPE